MLPLPVTHYLQTIQRGEELTTDEAEHLMDLCMDGQVDPVSLGALLMGLSVRGETTPELVGMLRSMRRHMVTLDLGAPVLDTCGTGGDGLHTFNVSTTAALVCGALGVPVAKHGNRAASSQCGSADVLEALGIPIELDPKAARRYFSKNNFVFLFAPLYHPAMKHVGPVRKALRVRTVFNFLGPMANPAQATHQLIGVSDPAKAELIGQTVIEASGQHAVVVYSDDGMDEASINAATTVYDVRPNSAARRFRIEPRTGLDAKDISGGSPADNALLIQRLAQGQGTAAQIEIVAMNAGLALYAADRAADYEAGKQQAERVLRSHALAPYLHQLTRPV